MPSRTLRGARGRAVLQRLVLRTSRTWLAVLWGALYALLQRALAWYLRRGEPGRSVYLTGGFATGEPLYGVSDVDLVVVDPSDPVRPGAGRERAARRWSALRDRLPRLDGPLQAAAMEQAALNSGPRSTFTFGLDRPTGREPAAYHGPVTVWTVGAASLLHGPGLSQPAGGWRLLAGPERRLAAEPVAGSDRPLFAWLSLQSWWRWTFDACLDPGRLHIPYLCLKLAAEPLRILHWLETGELLTGRTTPLHAPAAKRFAAATERALALDAALPAIPPSPLVRTLPDFLALSEQVAQTVTELAEVRGLAEVQLRGEPEDLILPGSGDGRLPLADWRSLCFWFPPDEALRPAPGDPTSPDDLAAAARRDDERCAPFFAQSGLVIQPTARIHERGVLRSVACPASDPVSFALLAGQRSAHFPRIRGWSVKDWACRATAEHRAWLGDADRHAHDDPGFALGKLFGAARAALLEESVHRGAPELPLTVTATAESLTELRPDARGLIRSSLARYRAWRREGRSVARDDVASLTRLVGSLPGYAASGERRVTSPASR